MGTDKKLETNSSGAIAIPDNWDKMTEEEQNTWVEAALKAIFQKN